MDKIIVLTEDLDDRLSYCRYQKTIDHDIGEFAEEEVMHIKLTSITITEEEIENEAFTRVEGVDFLNGWRDCWEYIKSRINQ